MPSWGEGTEHISQASSGNSVQLRPQKQRFHLTYSSQSSQPSPPVLSPPPPPMLPPPAEHALQAASYHSALALGRTHCSARVSSQAGP